MNDETQTEPTPEAPQTPEQATNDGQQTQDSLDVPQEGPAG